MSLETANSLIGLITIEPICRQSHSAGIAGECDATLGQSLSYLASDESAGEWACDRDSALALEEIEPVAAHFASNRFTLACRAGEPTELRANLLNLAEELELALLQVRRKIAATTQVSV